MKTLWCKNQENPCDRISHAWAPLSDGGLKQHGLFSNTPECDAPFQSAGVEGSVM